MRTAPALLSSPSTPCLIDSRPLSHTHFFGHVRRYVIVYYRGSNDAWDGYGGAVIYTRDQKVPPKWIPEIRQKLAQVHQLELVKCKQRRGAMPRPCTCPRAR